MEHYSTQNRYWAEAPIYVCAVAWAAVVLALSFSKGIFVSFGGIIGNANLFFASAVAWITVDLIWQLFKHRPDSPFGLAKDRYGHREIRLRFISGLPLLAIVIVLMPLFSKMKSMIPLFNEYTWDATFIAWDKAIFFGHHAWEVMQPLLGYPIITALIAVFYHLWMLLIFPGVLLFIYHPGVDETTRRRFFLSYVLSWALVGGAMATALASVGPAFLEELLGDPAFAPQMAYLNAANEQVPVMTLTVQGMLLDWFYADESGLGSGITAMPSMHVAIAFLYWLAARNIAPVLGKLALAFFIITWIGSVHTAYHYAVDGLVSVFAVLVLWWISGWVFKRWDALLERRSQAALRTNTVPAE